MKKFLVLMMVLGMATMANAALQISVGTDTDPAESEYTLTPSQELILDIFTDSFMAAGSGGYYALVVNINAGHIDYTTGNPVLVPPDGGMFITHEMSALDMGFPLPAGENGVGGSAVVQDSPSIAAGTKLFDGIVFHCIGPVFDAVIHLYESPDGTTINLVDTAIIHQIPEPMTMALLGLGGLFLRRRK